MIIFKEKEENICYIHIPKNSGRYIREKIKEEKALIEEYYWTTSTEFGFPYDKAHIPLRDARKFNVKNCSFMATIRNPYDRFISAYNWRKITGLNLHLSKQNLLKELRKVNFDKTYDVHMIHFYPQSYFLKDVGGIIGHVEVKKIEDGPPRFLKNASWKIAAYDIKKELTANEIKLIQEVYHEDFTLLGYTKEIQ